MRMFLKVQDSNNMLDCTVLGRDLTTSLFDELLCTWVGENVMDGQNQSNADVLLV